MREPAEQRFLSALRALGNSLQEFGAPWLVIGGVAVIAAGVPRLTADIDATVWAPGTDPEVLLDLLRIHRIVPRISDAITLAKERQVLLVQHEPSGVPVDLSLAWLPFEEEAIRCGVAGDYAGVPIRLPRPEKGTGHLSRGNSLISLERVFDSRQARVRAGRLSSRIRWRRSSFPSCCG